MALTVGDLRKIIEHLPDGLPVGVRGWFGEFHHFPFKPGVGVTCEEFARNKTKFDALMFDPVDVGEFPD